MGRLPEPYAGKLAGYGDETRRKLDALSPVELLARLIEVDRYQGLIKGASADLARGYAARSTAILRALPRAEVANRIAALRKTAAGAAAPHARECYAAITGLERDNPQPSDESVAEAKRRMRAQVLADLAVEEAKQKAARGRGRARRSTGGQPSAAEIKALVEREVRKASAPLEAHEKALRAEIARTKTSQANAEAAAKKQAAKQAKQMTPSPLHMGGPDGMLYKGPGA